MMTGRLTYDEICAARELIPVLERADLAFALQRAGKVLTDTELATLKERLDEALRLYISDRLVGLWAGTPSAIAKRLDRVVKNASRLLEDVGGCVDLPSEAVWLEIRKAAVPYAGVLSHLFNVAGPDWKVSPAQSGKPQIRMNDWPADVALERIRRGVELLQEIAQAAHLRQKQIMAAARELEKKHKETRVDHERSMARTRHRGDQAMPHLFSTLNWTWVEIVGESPGTSVTADGKPTGPYVRFLSAMFAAYASRVTSQLLVLIPTLKHDLELTPAAIRQRYQDSIKSA